MLIEWAIVEIFMCEGVIADANSIHKSPIDLDPVGARGRTRMEFFDEDVERLTICWGF